MKLFLFVLCSTFLSVQSKLTVKNNITLIKKGDPVEFVCDKALATWKLASSISPKCSYCPSPTCYVPYHYNTRITTVCNETNSILRFNSTQIVDDDITIQCPENDQTSISLRVGRYDGGLHSENNSTFALNQENFTLVCNKNFPHYWIDQHGTVLWNRVCSSTHPPHKPRKYEFTCNKPQEGSKMHIQNVTLSDDGKIFGCGMIQKLSLFTLTVNVPVKSVSIQPQSQVLVENEDGIFVCVVNESKPEASFKWFVFFQNGSSLEIQQNSTNISKTCTGKLWKTNSTLKLHLTIDYEKIMCKATIKDLTWISSEFQLLDIQNARTTTDDSTFLIVLYCVLPLNVIMIIITVITYFTF